MASGTTLDDLMYVGMVGIIDPERPQVEQAVAQLKSGGVIVKMITGDAEKTAKAIGKERFPSHVFDTISSFASIASEDLQWHRFNCLRRRSRSYDGNRA